MPVRERIKPSKTMLKRGKFAVIKSYDFMEMKPRGNYLTRNLVYYDRYGVMTMRMGRVEMLELGVRVDEHRSNCEEIYYVLEGKGTIGIDGKDYEVEQGDIAYVGANVWHGPHVNTGTGPFKLLYVVSQMLRAHELGQTQFRPEK